MRLFFILLYYLSITITRSPATATANPDLDSALGSADDDDTSTPLLFGSSDPTDPFFTHLDTPVNDQDLLAASIWDDNDITAPNFLDKAIITEAPDLFVPNNNNNDDDLLINGSTGLELPLESDPDDNNNDDQQQQQQQHLVQNYCAAMGGTAADANANANTIAKIRRRDWTWPLDGSGSDNSDKERNTICVPPAGAPASQTRPSPKEDCPPGYQPFCCFGDLSWTYSLWSVRYCNECKFFSFSSTAVFPHIYLEAGGGMGLHHLGGVYLSPIQLGT